MSSTVEHSKLFRAEGCAVHTQETFHRLLRGVLCTIVAACALYGLMCLILDLHEQNFIPERNGNSMSLI
jgi:hypothetical protein